MGLGQQTRLKNRCTGIEGGGHINCAHQPVFGNPQGYLHEGSRDHRGRQQDAGISPAGIGPADIGPAGISAQFGDALAHGAVPFIGAARIDIEAGGRRAEVEHVDGRQQGVQGAGQYRFARAPTPGDDDAAEARIDGGQQQGQLEDAVAGDGRQGETAGGGTGIAMAQSRGGGWVGRFGAATGRGGDAAGRGGGGRVGAAAGDHGERVAPGPGVACGSLADQGSLIRAL